MANSTTDIPIVFLAVGDPLRLGVVQSLPRPGGNVTGLMTVAGEGYSGKLLGLLKEAAPKTSRFGVLIVAGNPIHQVFAEGAKKFAPQLGTSLAVMSVKDAADIESTFEAAKRDGVQAMVIPGDLLISTNRDRIAALAQRHRLPTMFMFPYYAESGGMMAYGVSIDGLYKDAARMADKILRGARPRDMPVEQPTRFELVVNLKTARALGLAIPQSVLLRADRVIE